MSTWICKSALLAAIVGLAACAEGFNVTRSAPERVKLADGLVVAGARGWCVDQQTTRTSGDAAVVVFGSCAAIARNALAPRPDVPGVVTVLVDGSAESAPQTSILEQFFTTEAGRAALARDGNANSVRILESRRSGDLLFLHSEDRSAGLLADEAGDSWRALFGINGRFVTVSLVGMADHPISREAGIATLAAQVKRLKAANDA